MNEIISAYGIKFGQSIGFNPPPLKERARALVTDAQNGVIECTSENVKSSEFLGGGV